MKTNNFLITLPRTGLDIWLLTLTILLVLIGLLAIYDASVVAAFRDFGDKLYYFKNQLVWASLGFLSLLFLSFFDYHRLLKISPGILLVSLFLLLLVLIPHIGTKVYGARRWINIASFTFQPSEFAKIAAILYASSIMAKFEKYRIKLTDVAIVLFLPIFLLILLVLVEPDLGTALIFLGITLIVYFIGKGPIWHFLIAVPLFAAAAIVTIISQSYRLARLKAFIDPFYDPQGASYQINQIILALASGKLLGVGLGASRSKFAFIPEVQSDAIFAIWVEELGFIGGVLLIILFLFLISRALVVAREAPDYQGKILSCAITALLAIQAFFNLASVVVLVPLSGIPLPFISYGGSSLFVTMSAIGILMNIRRHSQLLVSR